MINIINEDLTLINDILKRNYFDYFKNQQKKIKIILDNNDDLDISIIKNNLFLLLNWYCKNNFICDIEITFSSLIEKINNNEIKNIVNSVINIFSNQKKRIPKNIYINTKLNNIDILKYIYISFQKININIIYKINANGQFCDDNYQENYYNTIIDFIHLYPNNVKIITTVTPNNIEYWIKNYKWWIKILPNWSLFNIIINEELNENWDLNAITAYLSFLDFQIDFLSEYCIKDFKTFIFDKNTNITFQTIQIIDQHILDNKKYYKNCDFHNTLTININNMNIIPCYKINNPEFQIGHFEIENNEIKQVYPNNIAMLIVCSHLKRSSTPHCEYCNYLNICTGPCYKNNYNVSYNLLCPILQSCQLLSSKYQFLLYKFQINHYLDDLKPINTFNKNLLTIIKNIQKEG